MMKSAQVESREGLSRVSASIADPAIKLFGSNIPIATAEASDPTSSTGLNACRQENVHSAQFHEEEQMEFGSNDLVSSSRSNDSPEEAGPKSSLKAIGGIIQELVRLPPPCQENVQVKAESAQNHVVSEKTTKRPDKPIPCPRCESLDTKFCYFNNYNVNQPRHFCRRCQRYWTAGGTLRNVPVGAGRRKNKHAASHQKHAACSDMTRVRSDPGDVAAQRCTSTLPIIGAASSFGKQPVVQAPSLDMCSTLTLDSPVYSPTTMVSFVQESRLCKSMATATLTMLKYTPGQNDARPCEEIKFEGNLLVTNEVHAPSMVSSDAAAPFPVSSTGKSVNEPAITQQIDDGINPGNDHKAKLANLPTYRGLWQLGNITSWKIPTDGAGPAGEGAVSLAPLPGLFPNGAPPGAFWESPSWPLMYPPAMWGAPPLTMPWGPAVAAAAAAAMVHNSGMGNTTVRKHQLEGSAPDGCIWVPKTLRIDDPVDAARSSIWATLGLGDGPASSPHGGPAAAKAFQDKPEGNATGESSTTFRHTNPAAFSRSAAFNESG